MDMDTLLRFRAHLLEEERAAATIAKYLHDVTVFLHYLGTRTLDKSEVIAYKTHLAERYAPASVNAALSSLNRYFRFLGREELTVRALRLQRNLFAGEDKELSRAEYERLLAAARGDDNERLYLLMQTVCATGIRISELPYITREAICHGVAEICCKGKRRRVLLPQALCRALLQYARREGIKGGPVFVTKNGKPLDRSNIWADMKKLCGAANVSQNKVFPHNLRHLFARTYYSIHKDIVRLADILGHTSVNTTRIYTMETGETHRRQLDRLGLFLRC